MLFFNRLVTVNFACLALISCASTVPAPPPCDLLIENVHIVDVAQGSITRNQAVVVENGFIAAITNVDKSSKRQCTSVVDGGGKYMMPGLNDAHVHLETNAFSNAFGLEEADIDYEARMALYLAHGVTGLRILSGGPDILAYRNENVQTASPLLSIASPMLSNTPPILPEPITKLAETPAAAREAVREQLSAGYDFIKIRGNLSATTLSAVLDEAAIQGAYVDGHLTRALTPEQALMSQQAAFAHLDEFAIGLSEQEQFATVSDMIAACNCFISSGLSVTRSIVDQLNDYNTAISRAEITYLHPLLVNAFWRKPNNPYFANNTPVAFFEGLHRNTKTLLKASVDKGAVIVAGTDAMNPMVIPGISLHEELDMMVDAGLTPAQALKTATTEVSETIPGFDSVGVLQKGWRANAILVIENPLDDLMSLRRPTAVIVNGYYLDRSALDERLERSIVVAP